jgi:hypothetical protein
MPKPKWYFCRSKLIYEEITLAYKFNGYYAAGHHRLPGILVEKKL